MKHKKKEEPLAPPVPRSRPAYRALLALVRVSNLLRKAGDRFFAARGLTQVQFNVLMVLKYDAPGGCSQRALGELLLVNAADVTGIVRRMLKSGLLARKHHPSDERAWVVRLSPKGRTALDPLEPAYYATVERIMGGHSPRDLDRLAQLLEKTERAIAAQDARGTG